MSDHHGWQDADSFTHTDPPTPKVHRVDSGRVDPHLTRHVGVTAAKEIRDLFESVLSDYANHLTVDPLEDARDLFNEYRSRLSDILGMQE